MESIKARPLPHILKLAKVIKEIKWMGYQRHKKYSPRHWQMQESQVQQDKPWRGLALPFDGWQVVDGCPDRKPRSP